MTKLTSAAIKELFIAEIIKDFPYVVSELYEHGITNFSRKKWKRMDKVRIKGFDINDGEYTFLYEDFANEFKTTPSIPHEKLIVC